RRRGGYDSAFQHAHFLRIREYASRFQDRGHLAERFEPVFLPRRQVVQYATRHVEAELVAGANSIAQTFDALERDEVAAVDRVAEEDASIELRDDRFDPRSVQRDRSVFARRTAAEVLASDENLVRRNELVVGVKRDVSLGQPGLRWRYAAESV